MSQTLSVLIFVDIYCCQQKKAEAAQERLAKLGFPLPGGKVGVLKAVGAETVNNNNNDCCVSTISNNDLCAYLWLLMPQMKSFFLGCSGGICTEPFDFKNFHCLRIIVSSLFHFSFFLFSYICDSHCTISHRTFLATMRTWESKQLFVVLCQLPSFYYYIPLIWNDVYSNCCSYRAPAIKAKLVKYFQLRKHAKEIKVCIINVNKKSSLTFELKPNYTFLTRYRLTKN